VAPGLHVAVGRAPDGDYGQVPTAWDLVAVDDGSLTVLGSTVLAPDYAGEAFAVTASGDVTGVVETGWSRLTRTEVRAAFVTRNGSLTLLPSGSRNEYGVGYDLNDSEVVGQTGRSSLNKYKTATQWDSRNKRQDLAETYLGAAWPLSSAEGINASGEIVGIGTAGAWLLRRQ
jgi:hypothetical protein